MAPSPTVVRFEQSLTDSFKTNVAPLIRKALQEEYGDQISSIKMSELPGPPNTNFVFSMGLKGTVGRNKQHESITVYLSPYAANGYGSIVIQGEGLNTPRQGHHRAKKTPRFSRHKDGTWNTEVIVAACIKAAGHVKKRCAKITCAEQLEDARRRAKRETEALQKKLADTDIYIDTRERWNEETESYDITFRVRIADMSFSQMAHFCGVPASDFDKHMPRIPLTYDMSMDIDYEAPGITSDQLELFLTRF